MKIIIDLDRPHEEHHILSRLYEIYEASPWVQNNGEMVLILGSDSLYSRGGEIKMVKNKDWKGTYIRCKFQINDLLIADEEFFSEYK